MNRSRILHIVLMLTIGSSALCAMTTEVKADTAVTAVATHTVSEEEKVMIQEIEKTDDKEVLGKFIFLAAEMGFVNALNTLLTGKNVAVNYKNDADRTALHIAAAFGNADFIQALIGAGANVDSRDKCDRTPLSDAIIWENYNCAQLLINAKANVHLKCTCGETPLSNAAFNARRIISKSPINTDHLRECKACIKLLLISGAPRNLGDAIVPYFIAGRPQEQALVDECVRELDKL